MMTRTYIVCERSYEVTDLAERTLEHSLNQTTLYLLKKVQFYGRHGPTQAAEVGGSGRQERETLHLFPCIHLLLKTVKLDSEHPAVCHTHILFLQICEITPGDVHHFSSHQNSVVSPNIYVIGQNRRMSDFHHFHGTESKRLCNGA